ncbi:alpha/beta fold hydrolase [Xylanimonas sp. McL0601]|uniref:alpha/beta fold hydrolase n=1 Tax=Xylanimonas sp. McL0601 TaxID=3414739 RepID=UPI003CE8BDDF
MTTHTLRSVDVAGLTVSYREAGDPAAPPLLLLHALGEGSVSWDPLLEPLAALGYRVLAPDARGHGGSGRGEYTFERLRDDATGFLEALAIDEADVVGHSMGALTAVLVAIAEPDRVRRLVLEDAGPERGGRQYDPFDEPDEELPFDWPVVNAIRAQRSDPDPNWFADAQRIAAPTLVIAGGPDSTMPQAELHDLVAGMPDARLVEIRAGHMVHDDAPEAWLSAVTAFLGPAADDAGR